jgi:dihydrofolate reductase
MRKVVAYELLSLDGVAEDPDKFFTDFDDAMEANLDHVISSQDTVLLGHRTFDEWAAFWPGSDIEPFASFINGVEKFIAASTPLESTWSNASTIDGELFAFVTELKGEPGADIGVHGSIALTQSLLELGLIDELRLVIAPALQRYGRRLFQKGLPTRLTLARHSESPAGYLMLDYHVGG